MTQSAPSDLPGPQPWGSDQPPGGPVILQPPREPWVTRAEARFAAVVIATLAVLGALAGLGWAGWSRTPTRGLVYTKTAIIPDQTEGFISSDGRFVIITGAIGLLAGALVWTLRAYRGPSTIAALGLGAVLGALLTDLIGRLVGGGTNSGTVNTLVARLPLQVHAYGAVVIEALLALAVYLVCAMLVGPDDLGHPVTALPLPDRDLGEGHPPLVGAGFDVQQPGGDRDAASSGQQQGFAAQ